MKKSILYFCAITAVATIVNNVAYAGNKTGNITEIVSCQTSSARYTLVKVSGTWIEVAKDVSTVGDDNRSVNTSFALAAYLSGKKVKIVYYSATSGKCGKTVSGYIRSDDSGTNFMISDEL